jgi:hypothetical protein
MKAPNFTRENAAEMARRATKARVASRLREKAELAAYRALERGEQTPDARTKRVLKQIKYCDELLDARPDAETFVKLTAAKERLWNLVFPKAGVMRPRSQPSRRPPPTSERPQEPSPAPIPPAV